MTKKSHNKSTFPASRAISTLGDLRDFILASDLPAAKKNPIASAIKRADELIGHGALDLPANERLIFERLEQLSAAMAGVTEGSLANMKSRLRKAYHLARGRLVNPRSRFPLKGEWGELQASLDTRIQRAASRLFHFAAGLGILPRHMSQAVIERFEMYLRDEAMVGHWEGTLRGSIRAWNSLAAARENLPALTPPPVKRTSYWIPPADWPLGLRDEVEALLDELANPNIFRGRKVRKLKPGTVGQYRHMTSTLVSAIVGDGVPLARLTSLRVALHPDHVARALAFLAARGGGSVTATMIQMMIRVRVMASICGLPTDQQEELDAIFHNLEEAAPPERLRRSMTAKNKALLDRIEHDKQFASLVYTLPDRLAADARAKQGKRSAPALMRTALAIHILLLCSVRRENLIGLELDRSIKRFGKPPHAKWIINLTPDEVKNHQELRHELEGPAAELLEEYLDHWRMKLSDKPNPWLFPGPDGEPIDPKTLASHIQAQTKRVLGVEITPHQFRHISAETFLLAHPDKFDLMSEHLGHRDRNTTRRYYARAKQKQASRAYREHVLKVRNEAKRHLTGPGRKLKRSGGSDAQ